MKYMNLCLLVICLSFPSCTSPKHPNAPEIAASFIPERDLPPEEYKQLKRSGGYVVVKAENGTDLETAFGQKVVTITGLLYQGTEQNNTEARMLGSSAPGAVNGAGGLNGTVQVVVEGVSRVHAAEKFGKSLRPAVYKHKETLKVEGGAGGAGGAGGTGTGGTAHAEGGDAEGGDALQQQESEVNGDFDNDVTAQGGDGGRANQQQFQQQQQEQIQKARAEAAARAAAAAAARAHVQKPHKGNHR